MPNCLDCITGKRLVELQLADNPELIKSAQITPEEAEANIAATCARALLSLNDMQDLGAWPSGVERASCPVLDVALYDVEVVKNA